MASMTTEMRRIAGGIAASRQARVKSLVQRHSAVRKGLHDMRTMRETMSHRQREDLAADRRQLLIEVEGLLSQLSCTRQDAAAAGRASATAFMQELTGRVAALRDMLNANQMARTASRQDRAKAVNARLAGYRKDRRDADAAWRGAPPVQQAPDEPASPRDGHDEGSR